MRKIKVTESIRDSIKIGAIMTVVDDYGGGDVTATIDGGDKFGWFMETGTYEEYTPVKIEAGKYYRTNDGHKVGPMKTWGAAISDMWHSDDSIDSWDGDGTSHLDDDYLNIVSEWHDTPVRDPELSSPYGDNNHPLPHMTGTLKKLRVQPGDVVECARTGMTFEIDRIDDCVAYGKTVWKSDDGGHEGTWYLGGLDTWRIISRAGGTPTKPKTWSEMDDAEKGGLLLSHHHGKVIEGIDVNDPNDEWETPTNRLWKEDIAYRVRPEPKMETVTKYGYLNGDDWFFGSCPISELDTHFFTFTTIDGEPDLDSIKMEKV